MIETIDPSIKLIKARKIRRYLKQTQKSSNNKNILHKIKLLLMVAIEIANGIETK